MAYRPHEELLDLRRVLGFVWTNADTCRIRRLEEGVLFLCLDVEQKRHWRMVGAL